MYICMYVHMYFVCMYIHTYGVSYAHAFIHTVLWLTFLTVEKGARQSVYLFGLPHNLLSSSAPHVPAFLSQTSWWLWC